MRTQPKETELHRLHGVVVLALCSQKEEKKEENVPYLITTSLLALFYFLNPEIKVLPDS